MGKRYGILLKIGLCSLVLVAIGYAQMIMYIDPPRVPPKSVGEQCTVTVRLRNASLIYAWQAGLYFNQNVLQGNTITFPDADSFLRYAYGISHGVFNIPGGWDNPSGILIACGGTQLGADSGGIGDGVLMKLIFDVVGSGSSMLDLTQENGITQAMLIDTALGTPFFICQDGFYGDETVSPTSSFAINTGSGHQIRPAVAWNSNDNEFLVVWEEYSTATGNSDIKGQRVSSVGSLLGPVIEISTDLVRQSFSPSVSWNGTNYVVVFTRKPIGNYMYDIIARTVSATGVAGSYTTVCNAARYQANPAIAWNGTYHLVVWEDARNSLQLPRIYGQRLDASGNLVGSNFYISSNDSYYHSFPRVASDSTDFLLIWLDSNPASATFGRIRDRRVFSDGSLGSINTVASDAGMGDLAWNGTNYLVTYQKSNASIQWDIYGLRVSSTGSTVGSEFSINTASNDQTWPRVIYETTSGKYLVNWVSEQSMPAIWRQAVNTNGTLYAGPSVQAEANYHQMYPALTNGNTQNLVVWADMRNGNFDIHGYRQVLIGIEEETQVDVKNIIQVSPTPATKNLKIMLNLSENCGDYHLTIYDATGRLVKDLTQLLNYQLPNNQIIWSGNDDSGRQLPGGVYFLKLQGSNHTEMKKFVIID
jgi:hypothetical protein